MSHTSYNRALYRRDQRLPIYIRNGLSELGEKDRYVSYQAIRNYVIDRTEADLGRRIAITDRKLSAILHFMIDNGQIEEGYRWVG